MKPERSLATLKISRYDHGGGRIYFDDGEHRELVADAYGEADRELIYTAIRASLGKPAEERGPEVGDIIACVWNGKPNGGIGVYAGRGMTKRGEWTEEPIVLMLRAEVEARVSARLEQEG